jgi:lysozyme family protein
MSKSFQTIIDKVLDNEGGLVEDPFDNGGLTNFGISQRQYPNLDIKSLTRQDAKEIYFLDYWLPYPFTQIENSQIQAKLFDMAVNMGHRQAFTLLQRSLLAFGIKVAQDGILGQKTLEGMKEKVGLLSALRCECAGFYRCIVARDPTQSKFLRGWEQRAYS